MNNFTLTKKILLSESKYSKEEIEQLDAEAKAEATEAEKAYVKAMTSTLGSDFRYDLHRESSWHYHVWTRSKWGENDFLEITINGITGGFYGGSQKFEYTMIGDVKYGNMGKVYSFGRRGFDVGIFEKADDPKGLIKPKELLKKIEEEVETRRARLNDSITVKIGHDNFTIHSKSLVSYKEQLEKTGTCWVHPAGMGVGYKLSTKPFKGPSYGDQGALPPEVSKLFGADKLYFQAFDAD